MGHRVPDPSTAKWHGHVVTLGFCDPRRNGQTVGIRRVLIMKSKQANKQRKETDCLFACFDFDCSSLYQKMQRLRFRGTQSLTLRLRCLGM